LAQAVDEEMAKQIYQDLLDKICRAYFENDFCAFEEAMHVPHHFRTECVAQQIDTIDQLRHAFNCFREYFLGFGVTDFFRTCTGATPIGTDKIVGRHVTELLQNGTRLRPPYEVWGTLELIGDSWKARPPRMRSRTCPGRPTPFARALKRYMNRHKADQQITSQMRRKI
jgi:hypothetical protein